MGVLGLFGGCLVGWSWGFFRVMFGRCLDVCLGMFGVIVWLCFGDAQGCFGDVSGYSFDASIILRLF